VERVWCVDCAGEVRRGPCNLRYGRPPEGIDVAFSEIVKHPAEVRRMLKPGAVWLVYGKVAPEGVLRQAGFSRIAYYAGGLRVPRALACIARNPVSAAYA
jgi:hypothetical protein